MARVVVNGLDMDVSMFTRVIAAMRGLFPNAVDDTMSDSQVVQTVMLIFIREWVATWEGSQAAPDPNDAAREAAAAAMEARQAAMSAAHQDATDIIPVDVTSAP